MQQYSPTEVFLESSQRTVKTVDGMFTVDSSLSAVFTGYVDVARADNCQRGGILRTEERVEIADHMIARWQAYKEKSLVTPVPPPLVMPPDSD